MVVSLSDILVLETCNVDSLSKLNGPRLSSACDTLTVCLENYNDIHSYRPRPLDHVGASFNHVYGM